MLDRGKLAVLTMFAVALAAATFAWWWNYSRGQKCLEFYGKDAALLVRTAKDVELLELIPDSDSPGDRSVDRLAIDGRTYLVHRASDISQAKGLIHARTSILDDTSFQWRSASLDCRPKLLYAVRFANDSRATLAFDFSCQTMWHVEQGKAVVLIPKVAQGWESFLKRKAKEQNGNTDPH
jgi:hypothetical protein